MTTKDNLKVAFAGEAQANRKYLAFAKKAEEDGFKQVARLFRAAANAETVHAMNHLEVLGIGDTKDNLKEAVDGETYEYSKMYPGFIEDASKEGNKQAEESFKRANAVEKVHEKLFSSALEDPDIPEEGVYVCQVCGNTVLKEAPDICPICQAPKTMFEKIE